MPKGKHGPALYELMGRGRNPDSESRSSDPAPQAQTGNLDLAHSLWGRVPERAREEPELARNRVSEAPKARALLEFAGGRVVLSLTHQWVAGLVFGMILLLFAAGYSGYAAGRTAGKRDLQASTDRDLETARNATPATEDVFAGTGLNSPLLTSRSSEADEKMVPSTDTMEWIPGYTYVCIQDFRASEKQAMESAREFLKERGIETEAIDRGKGDFRYSLFSRRGFNTKDKIQEQRLTDFWGQISEVGREYRKAGGKHNLEGYLTVYKP